MEVKFNFNIEICHFQDELQALGCLNTFLEDYSEWNSLGHYSPSLTKFALASAPPITAKHGWNSSSVILPLPLRAEKRHINCQMAATNLKTWPLIHKPVKPGECWQYVRQVRSWEPRNTIPRRPPQLQWPTTGWCSQPRSLPFSPPEPASPGTSGAAAIGLGWLCFRFTNDWNKIWWNLRR